MADDTIARLSAALLKCRDQFAFYAGEHRGAGKAEKAATNQRFADLASDALVGLEPAIKNPTGWFYAGHHDAEWWTMGGVDRDSTIAAARADMPREPVWILEAKRQIPNFHIFDADQINEQLLEDEVWGEDGWEGGHMDGPHAIELEARLAATLRGWFAECCDLHGAQLDFINGPEEVPPS